MRRIRQAGIVLGCAVFVMAGFSLAQECQVDYLSNQGATALYQPMEALLSGSYLYVHGGNFIKIYDISSPGMPVAVGTTDNLYTCGDSPVNSFDIALFPGDSVIFLSTKCRGIIAYDLDANPASPIRKGFARVYSSRAIASLKFEHARYLLSGAGNKIYYTDFTDLGTSTTEKLPVEWAWWNGISDQVSQMDCFYWNGVYYLAVNSLTAGFALYDVTNFPASATQVFSTAVESWGSRFYNGRLYVNGRNMNDGLPWGLRVFSVPEGQELGAFTSADFSQAINVWVQDRFAYLGLGSCQYTGGFEVVDISDPGNMNSILPVGFTPHECINARDFDIVPNPATPGSAIYFYSTALAAMEIYKIEYCGAFASIQLQEFSPSTAAPGTSFPLAVTLNNTGNADAAEISATLSEPHPGVSVDPPATQIYGPLAAGGAGVSRTYSITVAGDAAPGPIDFHLDISGPGVGPRTADFTVKIANPCSAPPGEFTLLAPPDGANGQSSPVILDWSDSSGADSFDLFLGTAVPPPLYQSVSGATQAEVSGLAGNTTYSWYVRAVNACGTKTTRKQTFHTASPSLTPARMVINDGCPYGGFGHGNHIAEPGETVQIWALLLNTGGGNATQVVGTLATEAPGVTILTGAVDFPIIPVGTESTSIAPFEILLSASLNCMTVIPFTLTLSGNGLTWMEHYNLQVGKRNHTLLMERFEAWPPDQWQVVNNGGTCVWESSATTGLPNHTGGSGHAAVADSDWCGGGATMNTELWTPSFSLPYASSATLCQPYGSTPPLYATVATLGFRASYRDVYGSAASLAARAPGEDGDAFAVDITSDGGINWTNLLFWDEDHSPFGPGVQAALDLTPYAGLSNLILRFVYYAMDWYWWAEVDDVEVKLPYACTKCGPPPSDFSLIYPANGAVGIAQDVTLDWEASENGTCYKFYFGTTIDPPIYDDYLTTSIRSMIGLQPFTWYYWRVEAMNEFGFTVASSETWRFKTTGDAAPMGVPDDSLRALRTGSQITMTWDQTCGQADDYTIYEGDLDGLNAYGTFSHSSIVCNDAGGDRTETFDPMGGNAYYLVVPRTAEGVEGSYGPNIPQGLDGMGCGVTEWRPEVCPVPIANSGIYHGYYQQTNNGDWAGYINSAGTFTLINGSLAAIGSGSESIIYISPANYVLALGQSSILAAPISLSEGQPFETMYDLQYDDGINTVLESTFHYSGTYENDHLFGTMDMQVTALDSNYSDFAGHWYYTFDMGVLNQGPGGSVLLGAATQTNNPDWSGYMNNPFILQTDGSSLTGIQLPYDFSMVYITPTNMPIMLDFDASAPLDFSPIPLMSGTPIAVSKTQFYNNGTMDVLRAVWTVSGAVQSSDLILGNIDAVVTALNVDYKDYAGHWTWSFTNGIENSGMRSAIAQDRGRPTISPPRSLSGKAPIRLHRSKGTATR